MDATYTGDFANGEVMHESLNGFRLEVKLELTVWLILFEHESRGTRCLEMKRTLSEQICTSLSIHDVGSLSD